ncbi:MAG: hypothetical protein C5B59_15610 [Bacteroidetes bacterium]|nr:MAG: hypothetical protein C5B59_15610 [Bacteroidota bacterium]
MRVVILLSEYSQVKELLNTTLQIMGQTPSQVTGLFLKKKNQPKPLSQRFSDRRDIESEEMPLFNDLIRWAEEITRNAGSAFKAIHGKEISLPQVVNQTTYADMIIAHAQTDFNDYLLTSMNASLKDMLVDAHCPILLARPSNQPIQKIVFTYDGSYSSMHAIKMFNYLFPLATQVPVSLVSIDSYRNDQKENEKLLDEWMAHHYGSIERETQQRTVKEQLLDIANRSNENTYVVMSTYGKEAYARIFHPSHVQLLLGYSKTSLFIAHE